MSKTRDDIEQELSQALEDNKGLILQGFVDLIVEGQRLINPQRGNTGFGGIHSGFDKLKKAGVNI